MADFTGAAEPLSRDGIGAVVDDLGVGTHELMALVSVESKSCGFLPDRRPVILFERHKFHAFTQGRFSAAHPDISNPQRGGYAGLAAEYPRLARAAALDRKAALMSASWGAGQVMGFNFQVAGFADVEGMVAAMQESEDRQLMAMGGFLKANGIVAPMRDHDWTAVARRYNGPGFAENKYDLRLAGAFQQIRSGLMPDLDVRAAQLYLLYLGFAPGAIDGVAGKLTRSAVERFRETAGLGGGDRIDAGLLDALRARVRAL